MHAHIYTDKSNEIGGDGNRAHPSLGHARRMMVAQAEAQEREMYACLQNHCPEVLVVDEITGPRQTQCVFSCKERGVRVIASAYAPSLRSLVNNPELCDFVGGVHEVCVCMCLCVCGCVCGCVQDL
jgi:stage III sporulation protein SpoIIIAA